jgi:lipoate-protein ligase A
VSTARLIVDPPAPGAWNMAVDEALLETAGQGVTTLRLYQWSEPTLSLGYFQAASERAGHAASRTCPLVRRASGGGAIVHDRELTYCLATPIAERLGAKANALYEIVHVALTESLADLGVQSHLHRPQATSERTAGQPFLCFQRRTPGDVMCGAAKIAGSAQRRHQGALAQHGSILLSQSAGAPELPGMAQLTGIEITTDELSRRFSDRLADKLGLIWNGSVLTPSEEVRGRALEAEKFGAAEWNFRRS